MADHNLKELQASEEKDRFPDVATRTRPDSIDSFRLHDKSISLTTDNNVELTITVVTEDILRLRYATPGDITEDFSYAIDPEFDPQPTDFEVNETKKCYEISTTSLTCRITKKKMQVQFLNADGEVLCEDESGYYKRESLMKGISEVSVCHKAPTDAEYFGLGDKAVGLRLRGRSYENWNTDSYAYGRGDDPLYRSVPFFMTLHKGRAHGIFMDNTYRSVFDFDRKKNNTMTFAAAGGKMDYYFINGPELTTVARRYAALTGTPELPPMWGLGYHQCRWSYYPESEVRNLAKKFRKLEIPCDAIYLDIDYMDEYKIFTWNDEYFPNPKKLISELKKEGFQTIVMIDPGVHMEDDYEVYEDGLSKDVFCKRPDGELMIGPVWPPRTVYPDYTNPTVRTWWSTLYKNFMSELEISGIWNDMNEPAMFEVLTKTIPENIRHNYDGHPCSHRKAHNIYGMQMARASLQGIKENAPDNRPFLLTRANFSGGQRYAALWTGDNIASWDHLRLANEQCQRLSISGYSFCGTDIGGFVDEPSPELYVRWLQLGIFHPLFRTHSMGYNVDGAAAVDQDEVEQKKVKEVRSQEPWSFGKRATNISRSTIELRYRLLSYLYTAFQRYVTEGTPILQPLVFHDQNDPNTIDQMDEFMFGDQILVSPVLEKGQKDKEVYLPGGDWYHYWDDKRLEGEQYHTIKTPLKQIPFFIKAGTVLPMREAMQYTGEKQPDKLELLVYWGDSPEKSVLYEDAEQGYDYEEGEFRHTSFQFTPQKDEINITTERKGVYQPTYDQIELSFIGLPFKPQNCIVDGNKIDINSQKRNGKSIYRVVINGTTFKELKIT